MISHNPGLPGLPGLYYHQPRNAITSLGLRDVVKIRKFIKLPQTPKVTLGLVSSMKNKHPSSPTNSVKLAQVPSESIKRLD